MLVLQFGRVRLLLGLQVDAEGKPEDEEGREDGCLWFLLEFLLDALQEVLQQL